MISVLLMGYRYSYRVMFYHYVVVTSRGNKLSPIASTTICCRYTSEARVTHFKADKRDPEWAFYDVTHATMAAYAVKPAAFDFLLTLGIVVYLSLIYAFLQVS